MSEPTDKPEGTSEELSDQIAKLMDRAGELQAEVAAGNRSNAEIKAELTDEIKPRLNELHAAREEELAKAANEAMLTEMREIAAEVRHPSKANLLGLGRDPGAGSPANLGSLIQSIVELKGSPDPAVKTQALANIKAMGSGYGYAPSDSAGAISTNEDGSAKATLSTTTGVGAGYLIPNALVTDVMTARGYPMSDFDRREEDLTVDHANVVHHYRAAREIAARHARHAAETEELRQALVHYRELFADLLEVHDPVRRTA